MVPHNADILFSSAECSWHCQLSAIFSQFRLKITSKCEVRIDVLTLFDFKYLIHSKHSTQIQVPETLVTCNVKGLVINYSWGGGAGAG